MTYEEALAFIHGTHKFGSKLGLDNIKTLLELLDSPEKSLKFIHVAGTNGKGSTCSFLHSILIEAGYKVGLYTSPFIETFNERMRVNHSLVTSDELTELTGLVKEKIDIMVSNGMNHPTEFEVVTAIAMLYFKKHHCDIVVLEVGLGGRLDATNVIESPLVSVITPLDFDHVEYLGDTIEKIAFEKAGIIKPQGFTVTYPQDVKALEVIREKCVACNNELTIVDYSTLRINSVDFGNLKFSYEDTQYELQLFAPYQPENAVMAIETIRVLIHRYGYGISQQAIQSGLAKTQWIGRLEIISNDPFIMIDGAHNLHGIRGLARSFDALKSNRKIVGIVGILKDKDVKGMLEVISPYLEGVIVTRPDNPRAMSSAELATYFDPKKVIAISDDISSAVDAMYRDNQAKSDETIYIAFGSLYMIGEVRTNVFNHRNDQES